MDGNRLRLLRSECSYGLRSIPWCHLAGRAPRALVFVQPLIGGSAAQALRQWRWLVRRGLDVFSFTYTGHAGQPGQFSPDVAVADTTAALGVAHRRARQLKVPVFAVAGCYGSTLLSHAIFRCTALPRRMVLLNPLPGVEIGAGLGAFQGYCRRHFGRRWPLGQFQTALECFVRELFPYTAANLGGFGSLRRERLLWLPTLREALRPSAACLRAFATDVLCLCADDDPVRRAAGFGRPEKLQAALRRNFPNLRIQRLRGGHYFRQENSRREVRRSVAAFLGA